MKTDGQNLYISVESLRNRITSRLIPFFFIILLINVFLSLTRIPTMGFQPLMAVHVLISCVSAILYISRKRIRPDISAWVMVGILSLLLISGVATLGLLSVTFLLGPMIALYLMLLGHRKSAYLSIVVILIYLSIMGVLFVSGLFNSIASPNLYVRTSTAWMTMILAVTGVSVAFVAPFELVPGALEGIEERFRLAFENANVGMCLTSLEGRFLKVNNALCEILGYSREELEKLNVSTITYQGDKELSLNSIKRQQSGGEEKISFEKRYIHKQGNVVWTNISSSLIRDSQRNPQYFITHIQNITERKRAEAALIESETKFRSIFENIHDVYFETALDGKILEISPSIELISKGQYTRNDVLGKSIMDFYQNSEAREIFLTSLIEHKQVSDFELILKNRDGSIVECSISAKLQKSVDRNTEIISGTIRDITERKRAEEAVRESENRFRQLGDVTLEGIAITEKGIVVDGNSRLAAMLGYELTEMIGRPVTDFVAPDSLSLVIRSIGKNVEEKYEHSLLRKDGSTIPVESHARTMPWNGKIMRVTAIRDLTERKRAETALKASESQFRELWESTVEGIAIHDKGIILEVNEAMCRMFGVEREKAIGKSLLDFAPTELRDALREHIASDEKDRLETPALRPNGTRLILEVFSKQIVYHGEKVRMAAVRDITERKGVEEALRESEERYQRITEAITDYIYTARVVNGRVAETTHGLGCMTVTGYHPNEFAGDPFLWFRMVMADDRPRVEEQAQRILTGQDPLPIEHRIIHKNGTVRWVRNTFVLHRDENGVLTAYDGLIQDITERKRAEEALQESETKYRELVEGSPDAIAIYVEGSIVFVNSAGVELIGAASKEELLGRPVIDLVHPEYKEMVAARMKDALSTGKSLPLLEEKFVRFDGSAVDVEVKALPVTFGKKAAVQIIVRDITERKKAQQALRESQLRYRATVEQSNEGITIADLDGRYIMVNPAFCKMTGYAEESLLTMKVSDLMPKQTSLKLFTRVSKEHEAGYRETELVRKDGTTFIALITGSSLEIGTHRYVQGIVQDITERKRAEEALRESEERFHSMFEMHDAVMLLIEPVSGRINDANPAAERFYGYSVHQLRGMFIQEINMMAPGDAAQERARALGSEKSYFNFSQRLANGDVRIVEVHSSPIMLDGKQSLFSIIHDITERKEAEEQLRKLSLAVEQSPASIVITDTHGIIEYVNPKFTQVTGYTLDETRGKKPNILKSGETSPEEYKRLWETITTGNDWRGEFHNKKKNGELFWEIASISPVKNANNVITNFVAVKEDITERKRAEEALRHAQKLESIGTLAGGIAHDFNNLLNAIMGQSSLALGRLPKESPAGNNIAKALKAAERAADLTRQLLAYSGKGKFLTDDFDLNRLVEENAQLLEVSVPKSAHLWYELDPAILNMRGDVGQIQQVVMNLIINAGEALGTKPGHITVRTGHIEVTEKDSEFWRYTNNPLPPGEYVSFQVNDTGAGITPEVLTRIFDPFFTTKFTGRGLGLAAVLGIIRGHHGGIRIQSERGKGTEFEVVFPMVNASALTNVPDMIATPAINGEEKTILVIDDEPFVLELLKDVFTDANFKVIEALNPVEGIELYRRHQQSILMVILDYSMPGMDGKAAFHELRKINPDVKVMLCSGYTEEEIKSAFGDIQPQAFIQKPYKPNSLLEKASNMLKRKNSKT